MNAVCIKVADSCQMGECACVAGRYAPSRISFSDCERVLRVGETCDVNNTHILPEYSHCFGGKVLCLYDFSVRIIFLEN